MSARNEYDNWIRWQMEKKRKGPKKYTAGLSPADKKKREAEIRRRAASSSPSYAPMPTDYGKDGKLRKTKTSKHTTKFKKKFGGKSGKK